MDSREQKHASLTALWCVATTTLFVSGIGEVHYSQAPLDAVTVALAGGAAATLGLCTAALLLAGRQVGALGPRARQVLFWLPAAGGLALAGYAATASNTIGAGAGFAGVAVGLGALAFLDRTLPSLHEKPTGVLALAAFGWVAASFACIAASRDRTAVGLGEAAVAVPLIAGAASMVVQLGHRWLSTVTARRQLLLAVAATAASWGGLWLVQGWLPEINQRLKTGLALSAVLGLVALAEPPASRHPGPRGLRRAATLLGVLVVGLFLLHSRRPVPERFHHIDPRSTTGTAVALLSVWDDADGDGFYSSQAGGNDCDDAAPDVNPLSSRVGGSCTSPLPLSAGEAAEATARHAVIFVIDAVRADLVENPESLKRFPAMQRLVAEGTTFRRAYAPGNATFASLFPIAMGHSTNAVMNAVVRGAPNYDELVGGAWLVDRLRDTHCTGIIFQAHDDAAWLFDFGPQQLDYVSYDSAVSATNHTSPLVLPKVEAALERCDGRPTLLVVYVDDPHKDPPGLVHTCRDGRREYGRECYEQEIELADEALSAVLDALETRGMASDTLVAVTSDHGEAFKLHHHDGHSSSVFDEQVHVPLILRGPTLTARSVDTPVSTLGLGPTVAAALGASWPAVYPSLLGLARGELDRYPAPVAANVLGWAQGSLRSPQSAIVRGRFKLVYEWVTTNVRVYDLQADPSEQRDVAANHPEVVAELREELLATEAALSTAWHAGRASETQ